MFQFPWKYSYRTVIADNTSRDWIGHVTCMAHGLKIRLPFFCDASERSTCTASSIFLTIVIKKIMFNVQENHAIMTRVKFVALACDLFSITFCLWLALQTFHLSVMYVFLTCYSIYYINIHLKKDWISIPVKFL